MFERVLECWRDLPDLSLREAGAVLGCAPKTVRGMVDRCELESRKRAGKIFVTVESVRRMVGETSESHANPASKIASITGRDRAALRELRGGR